MEASVSLKRSADLGSFSTFLLRVHTVVLSVLVLKWSTLQKRKQNDSRNPNGPNKARGSKKGGSVKSKFLKQFSQHVVFPIP